jgi:pimeloyl-ACP methyl ester carboxylesterase
MVHGLGGSIPGWDAIGPRLTHLGRVLALDLPGFGLTPPGPDWTLETHQAAIVSFIRHFGDSAILMGNSMGGLLTQLVAADHPELVDAMVLIAPASPPVIPDPRRNWQSATRLLLGSTPGIGPALNKLLLSSMTPEELIHTSLERISYKPRRIPLDLVESFVDVAETRSHFPWTVDAIPKTGRSIRQLLLHRPRFIEMVRRIKAPTLVVQGVEDRIVSPTSVEWLCSLRSDWEFVQMEDTGHTPQIDAPVRFLGVIEPWLASRLKQEIPV